MPKITSYRYARTQCFYDTYIDGDNKYLSKIEILFGNKSIEADGSFVLKRLGVVAPTTSSRLQDLMEKSLQWTFTMGDSPQYSQFAKCEIVEILPITISARQTFSVRMHWQNESDWVQFVASDEYKYVRFEMHGDLIYGD